MLLSRAESPDCIMMAPTPDFLHQISGRLPYSGVTKEGSTNYGRLDMSRERSCPITWPLGGCRHAGC